MQIRRRLLIGFAATLLFAAAPAVQAGSFFPDPLLHYTFDTADISGTTVTDFGTGGNNGTITGGFTSVPGVFGEAIQVTDSQFVTAGTPLLSQSDAFQPYTIAFWVNGSASDGGGIISQYVGNPSGDRFIITAQPSFGPAGDGMALWWHGSDGDRAETGSVVLDDTFHHVAFVKDSAQNLSVYVDGMLDQAGSLPDTDISSFTDAFFEVGNSSAHPFAGILDEVFVFDSALDAEQIGLLFDSNGPLPPEIPEPSSIALFVCAVILAGGLHWRRRRRIASL